jgi:hypothetical protein
MRLLRNLFPPPPHLKEFRKFPHLKLMRAKRKCVHARISSTSHTPTVLRIGLCTEAERRMPTHV